MLTVGTEIGFISQENFSESADATPPFWVGRELARNLREGKPTKIKIYAGEYHFSFRERSTRPLKFKGETVQIPVIEAEGDQNSSLTLVDHEKYPVLLEAVFDDDNFIRLLMVQ